MANPLTFQHVKFQWLQLLSMNAELSPRSIQIALYIVANHMFGKSDEAWASDETIAVKLNVTTKTVQRAKSELAGNWFEIIPGTNRGRATIYKISQKSLMDASNLHQEMSDKKPNNIVYLKASEVGQNCPERETNLSKEARQECPPNKETKIIKEIAPEPVFIPEHGSEMALSRMRWNKALSNNGFPELSKLLPTSEENGMRGFWVPRCEPPIHVKERTDFIHQWVSSLPVMEKISTG